MPKPRVIRHEVVQPLNESYRLIPLTKCQTAVVDKEDYESVAPYKWLAYKNQFHHCFYAVRKIYLGKVKGKKQYRSVYMHRQLLGLTAGDKREGDHRDGDGLNNQRYNLRICTHAGNMHNRRVSTKIGKSSKFKGVRWHGPAGKWNARICVNCTEIHLGLFTNETDAARAYNRAATECFGEFAKLNPV